MGEVNTEQKGNKGGQGGMNGCKKLSTRVDMTPVVDLAFLLLTFFMLATVFIKPQVMQLVLPEENAETDDSAPLINEKKILSIILGENNKIYWYVGVSDPQLKETDYSVTGIRKVLQDQGELIEKMYVLVKPDATSKYVNLVDMLDELEITNTERYALVDIEPVDQDLVARYLAAGGQPTAPVGQPSGQPAGGTPSEGGQTL